MVSKQTYWNHNGKYQVDRDELFSFSIYQTKEFPSYGNLFQFFHKIYTMYYEKGITFLWYWNHEIIENQDINSLTEKERILAIKWLNQFGFLQRTEDETFYENLRKCKKNIPKWFLKYEPCASNSLELKYEKLFDHVILWTLRQYNKHL